MKQKKYLKQLKKSNKGYKNDKEKSTYKNESKENCL